MASWAWQQAQAPWTRTQLKQMERQNLIMFNREDTHYRLTLKATTVREKALKKASDQP